MNILELLIAAIVLFILAYRFYAPFMASRMGVESDRPTPAVEKNDGIDFVPTSVPVLFAHHYSAIAGAGPIIGPIMGILYGVGPAWLWIVFGGIFFGAVHDFSTLFASIREGGQSIAEIARKALGDFGFLMFIAFTGIMLILVTSAFLSLTAISLTSIWPLDKLGLEMTQTLLKTRHVDGQTMGVIGGIASTSVIIITAGAPLLGFLIFKRRINTFLSFALAITVCVASVYAGFLWPVSISALVWMCIISVYVFFAARLPVWTILQPRDFINVQILYFGLVTMAVSVVIAGLGGASTVNMPTFNLAEGQAQMGPVWPILFIIIACGAISGFHALVAGGTTAKQLARESQAKFVAYGAMILESALAVLVVLTVASSLKYADYMAITWPATGNGNPILAYALAVGNLTHRALGIPVAFGAIIGILMVEGFIVTTLDAAVRLNRYIFEEFWKRAFKKAPAIFGKIWFNSGLAVILMFVLAVSNGYKLIWPVFGASNQLLAALSLLAVSAWLNIRGRANWFTLIPAIIMLATTIVALVYYLVDKYIPAGNFILILTDTVLLILALGVVIQTCRKSYGARRQRKTAPISA